MESFENNEFEHEPEVTPEEPAEPALNPADDGVYHTAGDMADTGLVDQLELIGAAWFRVFPNGKAPDGRKVENLFVYGNHDVSNYREDYLAKICPNEAERPSHRINRDPKGTWEKCLAKILSR